MADNKLIELIQNNELQKVKEYLDSIKNSYLTKVTNFLGFSYNAVNDLTPDKNSPLSIAVKNNNPAMVKLLLELGADINHQLNNKNLFELALENGANIDIAKVIRGDDNFKAKGNEDDLLKNLIVNKYYNDNYVMKRYIKYDEMLECLKLMQSPSFAIGRDDTIFQLFYHNKRELVDELVKLPGVNLLESDKNFLGEEIPSLLRFRSTKESTIKQLIDFGANINIGNSLGVALYHRKYDMVNFLLDKGAGINGYYNGRSNFKAMLETKEFELYAINNILPNPDFKITPEDKSALCFYYLKRKEYDQLKNFIDNNDLSSFSEIISSDNDFLRLFDYVVKHNNIEIADYLLSKGVNVNKYDRVYYSPFIQAINNNNFELAKKITSSKDFKLDEKDAGDIAHKAYLLLQDNKFAQAQELLGFLPNLNIDLNKKHTYAGLLFSTIYANLINDNKLEQAEFIKNQPGFIVDEESKELLARKIFASLKKNDYEQVSNFLRLRGDINSKIKDRNKETTIFSHCINNNYLQQAKFIREQSNFKLQEEDKHTLATKLLEKIQRRDPEILNLMELGAELAFKINEVDIVTALIQQGDLASVEYITDNLNYEISSDDKRAITNELMKRAKENRGYPFNEYIEKWKIDPLLIISESDLFSEMLKNGKIYFLKDASKLKKQLQFRLEDKHLEIIKSIFNDKYQDLAHVLRLLDLDRQVLDVIDINKTIIHVLTKKHSWEDQNQLCYDMGELAKQQKQLSFLEKLSEETKKHLNVRAAEQIENITKYHNQELFKSLIELGADVNIKNREGQTALNREIKDAIENWQGSYNQEFISFLLKNGANIGEIDNQNQSAISLLIKKERFDWIKNISNSLNKIPVKKEPIYIENALSEFSALFNQIMNDSDFLQALDNLNVKFNLNHKQQGETLLTKAIKEGDIKLIKLLIKRNVDVNVVNENNMLPLDLAIEAGNIQAIKCLLSLPDIAGDIEKAKEIINIKNILVNQARNFPDKPYISLAHSTLSINDLATEAMLKEYKEMKLESLYFQVDQLNLDHEFASFIKKATKAGVKEILVFCNQEKSELSSQLLLDFLAENKIRINLNIAPITNNDVVAVENDNLAQGNLLGCENIKFEEKAYSLKYSNDHEIKLLNNKECDEKILANYLEHRKKLIDPNLNELYQTKYILQDDSAKADRIQKTPNRNEMNLEYSVSVSNQVTNTLETSLDKEISVDIDKEQESKKYDRIQADPAVQKLDKLSFSENDLVEHKFLDASSTIKNAVWNVFRSSENIKYITEQALLIIIKNHNLINNQYVVEGIDLDNLPQGLAFKGDTIFASNMRPSNMQDNGFTIKKDYIAPSMEGPFRSWLQYASKEGLTPLKYYKTKLNTLRTDDPFINSDLGFPKNLQSSSIGFNDYGSFNYHNKMIKEFIFPSRSVTDEAYRGLAFIKLTATEKQKIDQIYQEFANRGIQQAFENIIKSHSIKKGDFLLKDETLAFFDKLFTEILPLNDSKKIDFFQKVLSQNTDQENLYLEDVFLSLDCFYNKYNEFIAKQEIAKEHYVFMNDAMITILSNLTKKAFTAKLNKIYGSIETTAANGGNLHELLYYYSQNDQSWLSQANFKEKLAKHKLNTIKSYIKVGTKEDLFIPFIKAQLNNFAEDATSSKQVEQWGFRPEVNTCLSIIPPHQRSAVDNYLNYMTIGNATDFKTGKRTNYLLRTEVDNLIEDRFLYQKNWYDLDKKAREAFIEKKNAEHLSLLDLKIKEYYDLHRDEITFIQTKGLVSEDGKCNLIDNYSSEQAENTVKLLSLNIITSSGNYYDLIYPDQEFSSYISVFNILFEKVKIDEPFQAGKVKEQSYAKISYKYEIATVEMTKDEYEAVVPVDEVTEKIKQHEKMIDEFIQIHSQIPEFNFAQITALGLVANLVPDKKAQTLLGAKELHQYGQQFSQLLRISLSSSTSNQQGLLELTTRANNIANNIEFLNQEYNGVKIHQLLTENGKNPENLAFFALCFTGEENLKFAQLEILITHVNALDKNLKWEFLEKIAHTQIPFEAGQIIDNHFPSITIEDLQYPERLQAIITNNNIPKINYTYKQRFNDISLDSRQNAQINFAELEKTYLEQADLSALKDLNYKQLKQKITTDPDLIVKLIKEPNDQDKEFISVFSQDLLQATISNIAQRTPTFELEAKKTVDLLFDHKKPLSEQFYAFEASYQLLEKIAKKLPNPSDKLLLIEQFTNKPRIAKEKCHEILQYLNVIDNENLASKNYNILQLTQEVGNQVLNEHFNSFKLSVDLFLSSKQSVDFKQLSNSLIALANKQYSEEQTLKILSYSIHNQDYTLANIFSQINGKTKNIQESIEFLTSLKSQDIKKIDNHISLKKLINLRPLKKFSLLAKIIQKYGNEITPEQYSQLYQSAVNKKKYEKNHYQKIFSYLINPEANLSNEETIGLIFDNYDNIKELQNKLKKVHDAQTNFNSERFRKKIEQITNLNTDNYGSLSIEKTDQLFEYGKIIYALAKEYSGLSLDELTLKSQELQYQRKLLKENTFAEKLNVDLQFLALSCQVMHLTNGKFPKDTQILSMLTTITDQGNLAQQISTGQGKGLIVALHAAYMSYLGQTTVVTTSSQDLTARDLKEFEPFYKGMHLNLGSKPILANSEGLTIENRGIYYSTPPDVALYLAQMKFNKNPNYEKLLADFSIISDEVDGKLTSEINYILGVTMATIEQGEAQSFFKHILEFSKSDIFLKSEVSRETDVHNLIESVKARFSKFDRSLQYPFSKIQLKKLASSNSLEAKEIMNINNVLSKLEAQGITFIIANLLEGAVQSTALKEGVDYVVSESESKFSEKLLNAIPINKAGTLAKGTRFGNAQPFINLKIKEEHPENKLEPDCTLPSSIIYDLTAKNLLDYARLAKGRIIGFTGTLGDPSQLEEFSTILAINSVAIPDYEDLKRVVTTHEVENKQEQYIALKKAIDQNKSDRPILIFVETNEEAGKLLAMLKNEGKQNLQFGDISLSETDMKEVIRKSGKNNYITVLTKGSGRGIDFKTENEQGFLGYNLCTELTINDLFQINGRVARQGTEGSMTSFFNKDQYRSFASHDQFMQYLSKRQTLEREKKRFIADVNMYFNEVNAGNREQAIKSHDFIDRTWKYILTSNDALPSDERKTLGQLHKQLLNAVNEEYPGDARDLQEYLLKLKECLPGESTVCHLETKFTIDPASQGEKPIEYKITPQNFPEILSLERVERVARSIHISNIQPPAEGDLAEYKVFYGILKDSQDAIINTHTLVITPAERKFNITYNYNDILPRNSPSYHTVTGEGSSGNLMLVELQKSIDAYRDFVSKHNSQEVNKIAAIIANTREAEEIDFNQFNPRKTQAIAVSVIASKSAQGNVGHAESILIDNNLLYLVNRGSGSEDKPGVKIYELIDDVEEVRKNLSKLKNETVTLGNLETDIINPIVKKNSKNNQPIYHYIPMPAQVIGNCGWAQLESQIKTIAIAGRLHEVKDRIDFEKLPKSAEFQSSLKKADAIYQDFSLYDQMRRMETEIYTRDANFKPHYMDKASVHRIDQQRSFWHKPISDEVFSASIKKFDENINIFKDSIYENYAEELSQQAHVELLSSSEMGEALKRNGIKDTKNLFKNLDLENLKTLEQFYNDVIKIHLKDSLNQDQVLIKILTYVNDNPEQESLFLNQLQEIFDKTKLQLEGKDYIIYTNMQIAANHQDKMLFSVLENFADKKEEPYKLIEFSQEASNFVQPYDPNNFDFFYNNRFIDQDKTTVKDNAKDNSTVKIPEITADGIIHQIQFLQAICTITKNVGYSLYCNFYIPNFSPDATKEELSQAKEIIKKSNNTLKEYGKTYDIINGIYQLKIRQHNKNPNDKLREEISNLEKTKDLYYTNIQSFKNLCEDFVTLKKEGLVLKKAHVEMLEGQYKKLDKIDQEVQKTVALAKIVNQQINNAKASFALPSTNPSLITSTNYLSPNNTTNSLQQNLKPLLKK